ncbi:MAG TPA: FlxA-like family protein [Burkholderiaceae bacterium]
MVSAVSAASALSTAYAVSNTSPSAQVAALQRQLAQYQKQLTQDESTTSKEAMAAATPTQAEQLLETQIAALQAQIAQLDNAATVSAASNAAQQTGAPSASTLGTVINVKV